MKKLILIFIIALTSCVKKSPAPTSTKVEYPNNYSYVKFYTSSKDLIWLSTPKGNWVYYNSDPKCDNIAYSVPVVFGTILTYTSIIYNDATDKTKGIKSQWSGSVTADKECVLKDVNL